MQRHQYQSQGRLTQSWSGSDSVRSPTLPSSRSCLLPHPPLSLATKPRIDPAREAGGMAYVDHAFSISDEDDLVGGAIGGPRGAPVKEIAFAAALLAFGALGVVAGLLMAANHVGGDRAHGIFFMILGIVMFIPGFYYTRIAYYAYKGFKGFSFSNIPPI